MDPAIEDRKGLWWLALGFTVGAPVLAVLTMVSMGQLAVMGGVGPDYWVVIVLLLAALWFCANVYVVMYAILSLWRLYTLQPTWTGKWQLTLGDMISVVFFAGISMSFFRALGRDVFIPVGIVISIFTTVGYLVSLLFTSRIGDFAGVAKWISAVYFLFATVLIVPFGIFLQLILIWLIASSLMAMFNATFALWS
jgi:hypothetical protein